jgi:predicted Na+-dependent transporter
MQRRAFALVFVVAIALTYVWELREHSLNARSTRVAIAALFLKSAFTMLRESFGELRILRSQYTTAA